MQELLNNKRDGPYKNTICRRRIVSCNGIAGKCVLVAVNILAVRSRLLDAPSRCLATEPTIMIASLMQGMLFVRAWRQFPRCLLRVAPRVWGMAGGSGVMTLRPLDNPWSTDFSEARWAVRLC